MKLPESLQPLCSAVGALLSGLALCAAAQAQVGLTTLTVCLCSILIQHRALRATPKIS